MAIRVMCPCGRSMVLSESQAGKLVQCSECGTHVHIPTSDEDAGLARWLCEKCGQRMKARARAAGKKTKCPRCATETTVPLGEVGSSFLERNFPVADDTKLTETKGLATPEFPTQPAATPAQPGRASAKEREEEYIELEPIEAYELGQAISAPADKPALADKPATPGNAAPPPARPPPAKSPKSPPKR